MTGRFGFGAVAATAGLLTLSLTPALPMQAAPPDRAAPAVHTAPAAPAKAQHYSWQWVDGSIETSRTFRQADYAGHVSRIAVMAQVRPAKPRHKVRVEVRQSGEWQTHASARTGKHSGRVTLRINPICTSGRWCHGTYSMRVHVLRKGSHPAAYKNLSVTFVRTGGGTPSRPGTPPVTQPQVDATLAGPIMYQKDTDGTPGAPTITSVEALQDPDHHADIVIDLAWDSPTFDASNPISKYWVLVTDDFSTGSIEDGYYSEFAADQRDVRVTGSSVIYAEKVPHKVAVSVVAFDSQGNPGVVAPWVYLDIGCDAYGPGTGPENIYRTLCEHDPS